MGGAPMELYVTDPMMEKDTAKWLTEIVFPIK
jgi:effector-binding domain-containing protein